MSPSDSLPDPTGAPGDAVSGARFPPDFLWGVATSAYQIEGSPLADGAGASNWHAFSHTPGRIANGDTGDVACDHYRRYAGDISLIRQLGAAAYRFSVAWSRIVPAGTGAVNRAGLDFYSRLVDELLGNNIKPCVTLYHWDHPAALDDRGGWLNRDMAEWFAEYTSRVMRALGDRVHMWMTLNEPWVVMDAGFLHGVHPPAHRSAAEAPLAAHNLLRGHGLAVEACRGIGGRAPIGIVVNIEPKDSASASAGDIAATRRADAYMNRYFLDPLFKGRYPGEMPEIFGDAWPDFPASDFDVISQPIDFLGVNYYTRGVMRNDPGGPPPRAARVHQSGRLHTGTGWEVHPESLTRALLWIRERYGNRPVYITENGAAFPDPVLPGDTNTAPDYSSNPVRVDTSLVPERAGVDDGVVQSEPAPVRILDPRRVDYLREHLRAARRARQQGVDLRGYFAWSLLDNFEWQCGYSKHFGLYQVDFATQRRRPKASAEFYREVINAGGPPEDC